MYSQQARPGAAPTISNRYMKGRLPDGVDFAAYPGRSSTPLPTAESKSAERINQLKIWNEAATNDDKRRLHSAKSSGANAATASAGRRTDSFKDAKDRHSASFHGTPENEARERAQIRSAAHPTRNSDMFADRSDSDSEEDAEESPLPPVHVKQQHAAQPVDTQLAAVSAVNAPLPLPSPPPQSSQAAAQASPLQHAPPKQARACCVIM